MLYRILTTIFVIGASSSALAEVEQAATRGSVGDIGNHYIAPPGITLDVMNNDFLGGTDKYMTGAMKAGLLRFFPDDGRGYSSSYEFMMNWRALTPAASGKVGSHKLKKVVGRFADWMESEMAYARTYSIFGRRLKGQLSLGIGHIGAKGMKQLHIAIHKAIGMQISGLEYDRQPEGRTVKYDGSIADVQKVLGDEVMVSLGSSHDRATVEAYLQLNVTHRFGENYHLGVEGRVIRQLGSDIYAGLDQVRAEASVAAKIHEYYQPSIKYVSPYVSDDQWGQFYAEILRFNIPF